MATPAEVTIGINAAMPVAMADVDQLVPAAFQGMVPMADVQKIVADIVMVSLAAVDASRVSTPPTPAPLTKTIVRLTKPRS
jgi:hypothetical protein